MRGVSDFVVSVFNDLSLLAVTVYRQDLGAGALFQEAR